MPCPPFHQPSTSVSFICLPLLLTGTHSTTTEHPPQSSLASISTSVSASVPVLVHPSRPSITLLTFFLPEIYPPCFPLLQSRHLAFLSLALTFTFTSSGKNRHQITHPHLTPAPWLTVSDRKLSVPLCFPRCSESISPRPPLSYWGFASPKRSYNDCAIAGFIYHLNYTYHRHFRRFRGDSKGAGTILGTPPSLVQTLLFFLWCLDRHASLLN